MRLPGRIVRRYDGWAGFEVRFTASRGAVTKDRGTSIGLHMQRGFFRRTDVRILWNPGLVASCLGVMLLCGGCPGGVFVPPPDVSDFEDGNVDEDAISPLGKTSGEPNGRFDNPVVAVFNDASVAALKGNVAQRGDLDVFLLGALAVGDLVEVDARASDGSLLDVSVGLFDAEERLVFTNDDRTAENLDSLIEHIVRHAGDRYYLVVTNAAFGTPGTTSGTYFVDITVTPGQEVPAPAQQVLFLDFDGGPITSPDLPQLEGGVVPPFDAGEIDAVYAGQSDAMKQVIIDIVKQNYRDFDVVVRSNDDPPREQETVFTTMLFGGFRNGIFGIAEDVDLYDADRCDDGIIFTETFVLDFFSFTPTVEQMGIAIGNVAAHEAGHLLGLNHVDNDLDLMDDTSPADAFVEDQEFLDSPLSTDIMSIGTLDSVLLLNETVGPAR